MTRLGVNRSGSSLRTLLGAAGCALVLATTGCGRSSAASGAVARGPSGGGSAYTLMQMNLCLSGLAACYRKVEYPAVLDEAVARIRRTHPDAVTFNEACRNDVAAIARRTGYHLRFSTVIYGGKPLPCVRPRGRGLFGDAVLTKSAISSSESREFAAEPGIERRRWLCVTTLVGVDVCTSHLDAGNEAQCADLAGVLTRRATARAVIFGGDLNRRTSCAPGGFWTRTDASAHQDPGLQQVYGSAALRSPTADVVPATHTDHDVLLAHARLTVDAPG